MAARTASPAASDSTSTSEGGSAGRSTTSNRCRRSPRVPGIPPAASPGGLLFGKKDAAFWSAFGRGRHCRRIGRPNFVEVMKLAVEDRALQQRPEFLAAAGPGPSSPVAGRRVSGNIHA